MATFFPRSRTLSRVRRSCSFSIRIKVPERLRGMLGGRAEIWRTLYTKNGHVAKLRAKVVEGNISRLFLHLEQYGSAMTKDQIDSLVHTWLHTTLEEWEKLRASGPELDDDQRDGQMDILGDQLEEAWTDLAFNRLSGIEKTADGLLTEQGVKVKKDSVEYKQLCRELLKANMQALKVERRRMDGEYDEEQPAVRPNVRLNGAAPLPAPVVTKRFSVVVEAYLKEFSNRQPRTQDMIRSSFANFLKATGGDRPIGNITKDDCRTYKESMTKDGLMPATVNKHLHSLDHYLNWAHGQGFLPEEWKNPVTGLRIAKSIVKAQKVKVVPFTDAELSAIFSSGEFVKWKTNHPERYYGLLALLLMAEALEYVSKEEIPTLWADVLILIGNANRQIGIRTSGASIHQHLGKATLAYRQALTVYTSDQFPQAWASIQNNLGITLGDQGTRTGGEEGTRLLAEAVAAYRAALTIRTKEQLPQTGP